ncbi:MAG: hypothetical protein WBA88_21870, partial [Pseudaminobacter sp.]
FGIGTRSIAVRLPRRKEESATPQAFCKSRTKICRIYNGLVRDGTGHQGKAQVDPTFRAGLERVEDEHATKDQRH